MRLPPDSRQDHGTDHYGNHNDPRNYKTDDRYFFRPVYFPVRMVKYFFWFHVQCALLYDISKAFGFKILMQVIC